MVKDLDLIISRGDRLGIIGPNGAGKTTLLQAHPRHARAGRGDGAPRHATSGAAYFDQMREALDPEKTVAETIAPGSDWVELERAASTS